MSCKDYELLMADVLGGEASAEDQASLEAHCATCAACREDYESAARTIGLMRTLRAPNVIVPVDFPDTSPGRASEGTWIIRNIRSIVRVAAMITISFSAGYLYRSASALSVTTRNSTAPEAPPTKISPRPPVPLNFETALAQAHSRNPSRSDLGKALSAVLRP